MGVLDLMKLDGDRAVITGGSKGIGRGIALSLAEAGAKVVVAARNPADVAAAASQMQALGHECYGVVADVAKPDDVKRLADEAVRLMGGLSIWVNNAGGQPDMKQRMFVDIPLDNFSAQIDLNMKSVWAGVVEASRRMDSGSIINISSLAAAPGGRHDGHSLYAAAKAAMNSLTRSLSHELAPHIRVNAVAPGTVPTETHFQTWGVDEAGAAELLKDLAIPLQRYGRPEDIGAAVVFLASRAASWITGECLYVTGGVGTAYSNWKPGDDD